MKSNKLLNRFFLDKPRPPKTKSKNYVCEYCLAEPGRSGCKVSECINKGR